MRKEGERRPARAGAAQVPAHPGAARGDAVVAPVDRPRAVGPDEGRVRRAATPRCRGSSSRRSSSGMPPEDLRDGVASVLDYLRRKRVLHDPEREIFSKYWMDGDLEMQQGYLPQLGNPVGTKLRRGREREGRARHAVAERSRRHHGAPDREEVGRAGRAASSDFLEGLFAFLDDERLLVPVQLKGVQGQAAAERQRGLPGRRGPAAAAAEPRRVALPELPPAHDAPHAGQKCPAWRCDGDAGVRARGPGQLRPAAARPGLLDAAAGGAHGDGAARRAGAAGEPVQGRLRRGQHASSARRRSSSAWTSASSTPC